MSLLMPSPEHEQHDGYLATYSQTCQPKVIGTGREVRGRRRDGTVFPLDLRVSETLGWETRVLHGHLARC